MNVRFALLLSLTSLGCSRAAPAASTDAGASTVDAPREIRVDASLLESGRIRTLVVERRAPSGAIRLPADVVSSPEGAASAGALLAGRIASFEAREGEPVKRGQVLAWLDSPEAARAVADLVRARVRVDTQARKVARLEQLVASEAAALVALEDAKLEHDLARADLGASKLLVTSLGLAEPRLSADREVPALGVRLPIRSPVDGTVVERTAELGAYVTPATHVFGLVTADSVVVEARIADGLPLAFGPSTMARVDRGTVHCAARVIGTLPQVDPATRMRRVRLVPEAACVGLVAGSQAEVEVNIPAGDAGTNDALVVPRSALFELKGTPMVFVMGSATGAFLLRAVEPGLQLGDDIVIRTGVEAGEHVVTEGAVLLKGEAMRAELGE